MVGATLERPQVWVLLTVVDKLADLCLGDMSSIPVGDKGTGPNEANVGQKPKIILVLST